VRTPVASGEEAPRLLLLAAEPGEKNDIVCSAKTSSEKTESWGEATRGERTCCLINGRGSCPRDAFGGLVGRSRLCESTGQRGSGGK